MTQPLALFGHEDVRQVEADARAVHATQALDGLGGVGGALRQGATHQTCRQLPQLGVGHAVRVGVQRRIAHRRRAQRVDGRGEMAVAADGLGEVDGADDGGQIRAGCRVLGAGCGAGCRCCVPGAVPGLPAEASAEAGCWVLKCGAPSRSNSARVEASTDEGSCWNRSYSSRTYPSLTPPNSRHSDITFSFYRTSQPDPTCPTDNLCVVQRDWFFDFDPDGGSVLRYAKILLSSSSGITW